EGAVQSEPVARGTACGSGGFCTGAGACGVCLPGQKRCDEAGLSVCSEAGQWDKGAACPPTQAMCSADAKGNGVCCAVGEPAAGRERTCARASDGAVRCWGSDGGGRLTGAPSPVAGVAGATLIAHGEAHGCALLGDGSVRCWGRNDSGQLGDGTI